MEHLYAPWRDSYISSKKSDCVFCDISKNPKNDTKNHVLYRDDLCFIVMNKYPYNAGHFMVIPHQHIDNIENLDNSTWINMSTLVKQGVQLLKDGFGVQGVNLGMNLGDIAGAGIAPHIHYHIVPRYKGDTNFISTIANSRVYSTDFEAIYSKIFTLSKKYFTSPSRGH